MDALRDCELQDQRLRRLHAYWRQRHVDGRPPSRAELDPLDFRYAIGLVTLVDVERDPLRFRFRLVASPVTRHLGYELTCRYLDELPERDMRSYLDSAYRRLATARVCLHDSGERLLARRIRRHESLILTCCAAAAAVTLSLTARVPPTP